MIDFQIDQFCGEYWQVMQKTKNEEKLLEHFRFLKEHMRTLLVLHQNGLMSRLADKSAEQTIKLMPVWFEDGTKQWYASAFVQAGLSALVYVWADRKFAETPQEMADMARCCIESQAFIFPASTGESPPAVP